MLLRENFCDITIFQFVGHLPGLVVASLSLCVKYLFWWVPVFFWSVVVQQLVEIGVFIRRR